MLSSPPNLEKATQNAKLFAEWVGFEAKVRGLTTLEIALALQGAEISLKDRYGEAWTIAWDLASRVWTRAKAMR